MSLENNCQHVLWTSGLLGALVKCKISTYKAFAREWSELASWVTVVATDIQTVKGASKAGLVTSFTCIYLCCHLNSEAVLALSPIMTLILVSVNSGSSSALMFVSSSSAFSSGCSAFYWDPRFVRSTSWIFVCLFTSIWHCSNVLLWLLRHRWLHRSAWKGFKRSIWDRMELSLVNWRPGTSAQTNYIEDNVFLFFPTLGIWKKHKKNIALT